MSKVAILQGFCRRFPEVPTFVLPVFLDGDGVLVCQTFDEQTRVAGFARVNTEVGYEKVSFSLGIKVGDAGIVGYEMSPRTVAMGNVSLMAEALHKHFELQLQSAPNDVPEVVVDFLGHARSVLRRGSSPPLALYFEKVVGLEPYRLSKVTLSHFQDRSTPTTQLEWEQRLRRAFGHTIDDPTDTHDIATNSLQALALNAELPSRDLLAAAIVQLLATGGLFSHVFLHDQKPLCLKCLYRAATRHPNPDSLNQLLRLTQSALDSKSPEKSGRLEFIQFALDQVALNFHGLAASLSEEDRESAAVRFAEMLQKLLGGGRLAADAQAALERLAETVSVERVWRIYVEQMEAASAMFSRVISDPRDMVGAVETAN